MVSSLTEELCFALRPSKWRQTLKNGALPLTHAEIGAFFFFSYAALFCLKGLEGWPCCIIINILGVVLDGMQRERQGTPLLGAPGWSCDWGSTSRSLPRPRALWLRPARITAVVLCGNDSSLLFLFLFLFYISHWTTAIQELPRTPQRKWTVVGRPSSTFPPDTFILMFGFLC